MQATRSLSLGLLVAHSKYKVHSKKNKTKKMTLVVFINGIWSNILFCEWVP